MKINKDIVHSLNPCHDGYAWYLKHGSEDLLDTLFEVNKFRSEWAHWLFTNLMTTNQRRQIAIFSAEQVIDIFEKKYPDDNRPRNAIDAAKRVSSEDTEGNRRAAKDAVSAAYSAYAASASANAADANLAASAAANAAAYASYAAAYYAQPADAAAAASASYAASANAQTASANAQTAASRVQMQETIIREAVRILDSRVSK